MSSEMTPEVRISGQMSNLQIEQSQLNFWRHSSNVLVVT